jgi:hypothetical protein
MRSSLTLEQLEAERQKSAQDFLRQLPHPYDKQLNMNKCYKAVHDWYMRRGQLPSTSHHVHMPNECSVNLTEQDSMALISNETAVTRFNETSQSFYLYRHPMDRFYQLFVKPETFFKRQ